MVLLNLQKAFDTIDHVIMLHKLEAIGLHPTVINWFQSYLRNRIRMVEVAGTLSTSANITSGVPQGSVLDPLLFLLFVNDITLSVACKLILFADDPALIVRG